MADESVNSKKVKFNLGTYQPEFANELESVLDWWLQYATDKENGGFYGSVNNKNIPNPLAEKGLILNARILWSFSAACHLSAKTEYRAAAARQFDYIRNHFCDDECGGLYYSVNYDGNPCQTQKSVMAHAYVVYALSEYAKCSGDQSALVLAQQYYSIIEQYAFDKEGQGYHDLFTRHWDLIKNDNGKEISAQLHLLEAYTNLYTTWPAPQLKQRIHNLVNLFSEKIVCAGTGHMYLSFLNTWQPADEMISFGHHAEAAWLLSKAAVVTADQAELEKINMLSVKMIDVALSGTDKKDGALWKEADLQTGKWLKEKHWWPQTEAITGFFHAWQVTGNQKYLEQGLQTWQFVKHHLIDVENGEWFWGIDEKYAVLDHEPKAGFWKCPYHTVRMCIEISNRINEYAVTMNHRQPFHHKFVRKAAS
jgi:mannobiose 2-epimerase